MIELRADEEIKIRKLRLLVLRLGRIQHIVPLMDLSVRECSISPVNNVDLTDASMPSALEKASFIRLPVKGGGASITIGQKS